MSNTDKVKGYLARVEGSNVMMYEFQYNPMGYELAFGAEWAYQQSPGHVLPTAQFSKVGPHTMQFTLQLEGMTRRGYNNNEGCQPDIEILETLTLPDVDDPTAGEFASPPIVLVGLGPRVVRGVVEPVRVRVTQMVPKTLCPLYAEAEITIHRVTKTLLDDLKAISTLRAKVLGMLKQPAPAQAALFLG